jgi:beta-lactamase superfamily II metal-dependent hydrolase
MKIQIFDVEHGGCALVTADTFARILIDAGHNATSDWRPSKYLTDLGVGHLEQLVITNYDEDHASDLANLLGVVSVRVLTTNPSVTSSDLKKLKNIGGIGQGIEALVGLKAQYTFSVSEPGPDFGNLSLQYFWNRYPENFEDENNLSLVVILRAHGLTICFPGDMEVAGWKNLLKNVDFVKAIGEVNAFVASHHGRQNGCCEELFYPNTSLKPAIVIISDSGIEHATQETVDWYRNRVTGIDLHGERRHVLTTRRDGRILIEATPGSTVVNVTRQRVRRYV